MSAVLGGDVVIGGDMGWEKSCCSASGSPRLQLKGSSLLIPAQRLWDELVVGHVGWWLGMLAGGCAMSSIVATWRRLLASSSLVRSLDCVDQSVAQGPSSRVRGALPLARQGSGRELNS